MKPHQPPFARSSIPSCASERTNSQSVLNAAGSCCSCSKIRAVQRASACRAIHSLFLANVTNGIAAGFWAGQSNGCVVADRDRHSRLQNRAVHGADAGQETLSDDPVSGVEQCAHAAEAVCRS